MICVNHHGGYMCVSPSARVITFGGDDRSAWEAQIDDEDDTHVPQPQYSPIHTPLEPPDPHDVDECAEDHSPCIEPLVCTNVPGTFHCQCPKGYLTTQYVHLDPTDVDECQLRPCQQVCVNTPGSFQCQCHRGFTLTADGRGCEGKQLERRHNAKSYFKSCHSCPISESGLSNCTPCPADVDECQAHVSPCRYNCHNTPGSFYCSCPHGFALHRNARDCVDINECDSGSHDCGPSSDCMNMPGGYRCIEKMRCQSPYSRVSHDTCACTAGHSACLRRPHSISRRFIFMSTKRRAPANLFHVRATRIQRGAHASFRLRSDSPGVPAHFILTVGIFSSFYFLLVLFNNKMQPPELLSQHHAIVFKLGASSDFMHCMI
uniref:EGF-like domain-containing protein n=1 Tax=Eptatretus burgeri TaxID=7764 RepID=A0A8C4WUQ4_EPTBU